MLLLTNSPGRSALSHLGSMNGDTRIELNPPIWNSGRSVHKYISGCASSNPRMSPVTDHADFEGQATASACPMRLRRTLSPSDCNFTASTRRNFECVESSNLIRLKAWMVSRPSLDEASKVDEACLENPVENSISAQQIQNQDSDSTSTSISHPFCSSLISMKGEELDGNNVRVTSTNNTELLDSFVETLPDNYLLVSGKKEDYKCSNLEPDLDGVPLLCTARGCRVAHASDSENISGGSGIERVRNCEAADDQNFKSSANMYYQSMLEANPGNPLLLSNYAKFLHEVQHDMAKAEEYYERAILASPGDAEVLSLYAKFTWETHNDAARAEDFFDRAVKTAPDDCYVLSSYAHFLWNLEEGD